ncbi:TerB family tellurite resistance protein [Candidatus Poseidoniaceae archaeon]|nr:TerB family tellurite resistance protein [Candidatus Poseidoniaceae archaeon]
MKSVYLDLAVDFAQEDVTGYAELMVIVASADGTLVKEELAIIEALMGRCMMHPEMRVNIRNMLESPPSLDLVVAKLNPVVLKIALRDAMLVAAVDGEYDDSEIKVIKALAKAAGVRKKELSALFEWVKSGWEWHNESFQHLGLL